MTVDSLSAPLADPAVQAVLTDANLSVAGTGYGVANPALVSSSTTSVDTLPVSSVVTRNASVAQVSLSSSTALRVVCVGDLGDLAQTPPPLPEAPSCSPGAWKVELRPSGVSGMLPVSDRLDDTNTHTQTDRFSTLLVTGELTTSHFEIVAHALPSPPCLATPRQGTIGAGTHYECNSASRHAVQHDSTTSFATNAWSTRITGHLADGPPLFDVTINATVSPELDDAVLHAFEDARRTVAEAAGPGIPVTGPMRLSSSARPVTDAYLPGAAKVLRLKYLLNASSGLTESAVCVGDFGDLIQPPDLFPRPPCPLGAPSAMLSPSRFSTCGGFIILICRFFYDEVVSTHVHTQRDVYAGIYVTGTLTTSHYELVAEGTTSTLIVPIILSPTGGSAFTSELTLTNRGATDAQVSYLYTPAFGGAAGTATDTLPAERQRVIPDAIAYLEGLGVTNAGSGGTLRITFSDHSSADVVSATVRTTVLVPGGRAGLAYAGLPPSRLLSQPVFLCGLRQDATDRSNVAVLNAGDSGDGDVTLRLTVFSGDPADSQSKVLPDVTLSPGGFVQISGILVSNGLALSNGYAKVERISGTAPFYAYGVINDQITSDGSFVEPVAASPVSPITSMTLPALVETSAYETELILTNVSSSPRTLRFTWVSPSLTGGQAAFSIALLPGEQQILPALVQLLRDRNVVTIPFGPSLAGALFVSDESGDLRGVSVAARITTITAGGRFGVFVPAYPGGSEATTSAWLYGLQQNAETRSNVALVNTGSTDASPSTFRIDLFDGATGAKAGSLVSSVPARSVVQIDRILASYAPGTSSGYALVTKISGNNPFLAYAVLNDGAEPGQRSGDGAFVTASIPSP
ncbi:MAG: hypothetical protein NEA02_17010 [Thermoanaerobaculia bacterium]|nr:hypothetical protein [Thermoanaerobaculia bacterium]